jgi:hypothetical protein
MCHTVASNERVFDVAIKQHKCGRWDGRDGVSPMVSTDKSDMALALELGLALGLIV